MQRRLTRIASVVGLILIIPLAGTLLQEFAGIGGWDWGVMDFVIMGILLFVTGVAIDTAARRINDPVARILTCFVILLILVTLWIELAVGGVSQLATLLTR